jgi:sulfite reductase (NADPH) flavoprotein alpha-component
MLAESKLKTFLDLTQNFTKEELIWVNGYLSGLVANGQTSRTINGNGHATTGVKKISLVFGTETGNSKKLAGDFAVKAKKKGIAVKLISLDQYRFSDLGKEEYFFVVISTHGEGEPPAAAKKFYDYVHQEDLKLPGLKYSVLALGDTAYPLFCTAGEDIDTKLEKAGGKRIVSLQKCDVDFDNDAEKWFEQVLKKLEDQLSINKPIITQIEKKSNGKKYYDGKVITNINLNDRGSGKETYHLEISTGGAVDYEPGDSLAFVPGNKKIIVDKIINLSAIEPALMIETAKITASAVELLSRHLNICYLLTSVIRKYAAISGHDIPDTRMDLIDLLRIYPLKDSLQFAEVIKVLTPIAPRLYSISSAPAVHDGEVHLTINKDSFFVEEEQRYGLCSDFLGELPVGTEVKFYVHRNRAFKLPAEDKDIIMIGPGTGIAPFRSFLAERDATGATGRNWLFFGDRHFTTDFLYQTEMQNYLQTGVLTKVSLAFSRDQDQKIYVQHKMLKHGAAFFDWLQTGAYVYVCGSKDPMSREVENILLQIIEQFGNRSKEEAQQYLDELKTAGRYLKDVY